MKIISTFWYIAAMIGALCMISCDATKTSKEGKKIRQVASELNGEWQAPCQKQEWSGFTEVSDRYKFSGLGDFEKETALFQSTCRNADLVMFTSGTYDSLGRDKNNADAKDINFTVTKASVTPKSDAAVKALNNIKFCSISNWTIDKQEDVLGKNCEGFNFKNGDTMQDIYRVETRQLNFGKKSLFLVGESNQRPDKLDEEHIFMKK